VGAASVATPPPIPSLPSMEELPDPSVLPFGLRLSVIEFEKDNERNHHVDFITAASNLRAANYGIPVADRTKTKMIAGKIIPAMVTTTSLVTGLVMVEVLRYLGGARTLTAFRNSFTNLALPLFTFSDPVGTAGRNFDRPDGSCVTWTMWDRIDVDLGPKVTVQQMVRHLESTQQFEIFMISLPSAKTIYSAFGAKKDLNRPVVDVARDRGADITSETTHLMLVVAASFGDVDADVPSVRLRI
jgi:ubiquitin-activating enzyme E1